jgi:succinyl-CoA synthetase beta subunit
MNLHEYQGKQLFAKYGLPVSTGLIAKTAEEARTAAEKLGGPVWVVKAQVHAGGRGKAGGVKLVKSVDDVVAFAKAQLGTRLVTFQTDAKGQPVDIIYIEEPTDIARELYVGAVVDRATRKVVFMVSTEGGVNIEDVAHDTPEKIIKMVIDPLIGAQAFQGRELAKALGLDAKQTRQFADVFQKLAQLFVEEDLALLEINPFVVKTDGNLHCLDAKIVIDGNALFRHPDLKAMDDPSQVDERERRAAEHELNYVALEGNIGCMVNGAGLAMATMDLIKLKGGQPANFLDVGGGATKERVTEAFKIILSDTAVEAVLVNIFGGIVSCAMIAEGIIAAVKDVGVKVPVVVRLEGNNAELGAKILRESGLNIISATSLNDAGDQVVKVVANKAGA